MTAGIPAQENFAPQALQRMGCDSTARSGFFRDYQVAFPSDCNASFDERIHQASLKTIDMSFGRVMVSVS
jgi:nicotinamidase-related amidase